MTQLTALNDRITQLETRSRRLQLTVTALAVLLAASVTTLRPSAQQPTDVLRVKGLIVEDATGRARIVLGAPIAEGADSRRTGLKILDAAGAERIGISALNNGDAVIGLDAPPGTGDDRNAERITLVADAKGGASIAFKDRRTYVAARMYLDPQNLVWMQFSDFTQTPAILRRMGLKGDETIRPNSQP
jgi:hypothetical protein